MPLVEALLAAALVSGAVTVASVFVPLQHVATAVGFAFLAATWWLVWRRDDATVRRFGLALGGLVMPGHFEVGEVARSFGKAILWASAFAAVCFVPFYFGWVRFWAPSLHFSLAFDLKDTASEVFGQVVVIALPEEAFYRGYLQTRLDDALPWRVPVLGAKIGLGLPLGAVVFALGHLATIHHPARLAVFFPALLFGWLRARTGGIGASVGFHAMCNVFSEMLGRGYGVY